MTTSTTDQGAVYRIVGHPTGTGMVGDLYRLHNGQPQIRYSFSPEWRPSGFFSVAALERSGYVVERVDTVPDSARVWTAVDYETGRHVMTPQCTFAEVKWWLDQQCDDVDACPQIVTAGEYRAAWHEAADAERREAGLTRAVAEFDPTDPRPA